MGKKKRIEAKPTKYRGIKFKSRLEARWAIYLDFNPMIDHWQYEPRSFRHPETGWTYTPDFVIQMGGNIQCWLEVKPMMPTEETLENLSAFVPMLPGCNGYHLLLCMGDFFNSVPKIFKMIPDVVPTVKQANKRTVKLTGFPILYHAGALKKADGYRFDLPEDRPKIREGDNKRTPFDHWREWQEKEGKDNRKG